MSIASNFVPNWILEIDRMAADFHAHHSIDAWISPFPRGAHYPNSYSVQNHFRKFQSKIFEDFLDRLVLGESAEPLLGFLENTRCIIKLIANCDARDFRAFGALDEAIILHREAICAVRNMKDAVENVFRLNDILNEDEDWGEDEVSINTYRFAAPLTNFSPLLSEIDKTRLDFMYDIAQCLSFQRPSLASDRKSNAGILQSIEVATNSIGYLSYGLAKQEEGYRNGGEDDLGEGWDHRLMHQVHLDALENQLECLTCALEEAGKDERMPPRRIGDPPRRWVDEGDYSDD